MIMFMASCAALYVWTHYQYAFALLLWHLSPPEYANELYKDSPLIFAVLLIVLLILLSKLLKAMQGRGGK